MDIRFKAPKLHYWILKEKHDPSDKNIPGLLAVVSSMSGLDSTEKIHTIVQGKKQTSDTKVK